MTASYFISPSSHGGMRWTYNASYTKTNDSSGSYTWSGCDLGTPATDRLIVVAISGLRPDAITSMTVGGETATTFGTNMRRSIGYVTVPTGATGTIVLATDGSTSSDITISVYSLYNAEYVAYSVAAEDPLSESYSLPVGRLVIASYASGTAMTVSAPALTDTSQDYAAQNDQIYVERRSGITTVSSQEATAESSSDIYFIAANFKAAQ